MRASLILVSIIVSAVVSLIVGFVAISQLSLSGSISIATPMPTPIPTPLARYEIENLKSATISEGEIEILETISEEDTFTSYLFKYSFDPAIDTGKIKQVTGQINIPNGEGEYPLILMARGYVDQSIYETGIGTRPSAAYYAENGFVTVAPDFLGYGGSSSESGDIFETRFQTYTTFLSLIKTLNPEFAAKTKNTIKWNGKDIFIWAHSNGGQIALTALAVTGQTTPTVLWAPVTKPFPYSILYYTDESVDNGKFIRKELSKFEQVYDVDKFSFTNYIESINAPIQFHQGGADDAIPTSWSISFVSKLRALEKEVEYFYYPNSDHNMRPDWDTVVARDVDFFNTFIEN